MSHLWPRPRSGVDLTRSLSRFARADEEGRVWPRHLSHTSLRPWSCSPCQCTSIQSVHKTRPSCSSRQHVAQMASFTGYFMRAIGKYGLLLDLYTLAVCHITEGSAVHSRLLSYLHPVSIRIGQGNIVSGCSSFQRVSC